MLNLVNKFERTLLCPHPGDMPLLGSVVHFRFSNEYYDYVREHCCVLTVKPPPTSTTPPNPAALPSPTSQRHLDMRLAGF